MDVLEKKAFRAEIKKRNLALTQRQRAEASSRIFGRVESLAEFAVARCVATFCAMADEPESTDALARWSLSKRVVVPRVEGDTMQFYDYAAGGLRVGAFGIVEPAATDASSLPSEIDLIVVPGVAFTAAGARMGRGKGFYDRYLSSAGFRATKVGVCYAHQLVAQLPVEAHDKFMDYVITG